MTEALHEQTATQLARAVQAGDYSAREVVRHFIDRITAVDGSLNAVVWRCFDAAESEATRADQRQAARKQLGPLHGVPITIKDMFDVAGTPTTAGIDTLRTRRLARDAEIVRRLRAAGAIVLGKTNVAQAGMMAESDNPVYGRTNNPWNVQRSAGGSSGGEAAIIAACGSPLGLGSDGGGSIRQPAHACGVFGLKPTGRRLPLDGHFVPSNWPREWVQPGPMARSTEDLALALQVMSHGSEPIRRLDESPFLAPNGSASRPRVGILPALEVLAPCPAAERAVGVAAQLLADAGCEVKEFQMPSAWEGWQLFMQVFYADGLNEIRMALRRSTVDARVKRFVAFSRMPFAARPLIRLISRAMGQQRTAQLLAWVPRAVVDARTYCSLLRKQQEYRDRFRHAMTSQQVDVVLLPASPVPAWPHGDAMANYSTLYTAIFNLLAVPAGVVPVTRVQAEEETQRPATRDAVDGAMRRAELGSAGMPIGVQVVGSWWREDQVLRTMQILEESLRPRSDFPRCPSGELRGES